MKAKIVGALIAAVVAITVAAIQYLLAPWLTRNDAVKIIEENRPLWKTFPAVTTKQNQEQRLGRWNMCMLSSVGTLNAEQACTCILDHKEDQQDLPEWTLHVALDAHVAGECTCQASCLANLAVGTASHRE